MSYATHMYGRDGSVACNFLYDLTFPVLNAERSYCTPTGYTIVRTLGSRLALGSDTCVTVRYTPHLPSPHTRSPAACALALAHTQSQKRLRSGRLSHSSHTHPHAQLSIHTHTHAQLQLFTHSRSTCTCTTLYTRVVGAPTRTHAPTASPCPSSCRRHQRPGCEA